MDPNLLNSLLSRKLLVTNSNILRNFFEGKNILITGGGGTIGSEICRQISSFNPKKIIIFDNCENNVHEIQQEILSKYKNNFEFIVSVSSIREQDRVDDIFHKHKPDIVFHTAAYKHLSLMEKNPLEAIRTNIFGTINIVEAAKKYKVNKVIFTSSDKAVNPTCIMGFTKRISEIYISHIAYKHNISYTSVRFGNVLGSSGSVFSIFSRQIKNGGPITVTHPDVTRYFMTIQEAAHLVMQVVIQVEIEAKGDEIFILNMKHPIKIVELAHKLASLYGYKIGKDIDIEFIGLRDAEKLDEELFFKDEEVRKLSGNNLFLVKNNIGDMNDYWDGLSILKTIKNNNYNYIYSLLKIMSGEQGNDT